MGKMKGFFIIAFAIFVSAVAIQIANASDVSRSFSSGSVQYGENVTVSLTVTATNGEMIWAIDEIVPQGWSIEEYSGNFSFNETGHLKAIYYSKSAPAPNETLSYIVKAPSQSGTYNFVGYYIFENMIDNATISGSSQVSVSSLACSDNDGDGYDVCSPGDPGDDGKQADCDDDPNSCGANCNPGLSETCDGYDNDCDGYTDKYPNGTLLERVCGPSNDTGACQYGTSVCSGGVWGTCTGAVYPSPEVCNYGIYNNDSADDDCNGVIDDVGGGASVDATNCQCYNGNAPLPEEACPLNGIDDDCDGIIDGNSCGCTPGEEIPCPLQSGVCNGSYVICPDNGEIPGCDDSIYLSFSSSYESNETSCDSLDNDCDSSVDEGVKLTFYIDSDNDGFGSELSDTLACMLPSGYVNNSYDCNDSDPGIYPGANEICNEMDDNCDGNIDFDTDPGDLNCTGVRVFVSNSYYDGSTTNFSAVNLSSIENLVLEKTEYGKVVFNQPVKISVSININPPVTIIKHNTVRINTSKLKMLNKSATIYLYNITLNNPVILKDGDVCPESICNIVSYSNNVLVFNVTGFSEYSAQGRCDDGTWYGQCVFERTGNESDKPKYCENGIITDKASLCGCPSGLSQSGESCTSGSGIVPVCTPGETNVCNPAGTTVGECKAGVQTCVDGFWSSCEGAVMPQNETCDGKDNDCDGSIDEDCLCIDGDTRPCGTDIGACQYGISTCENGDWSECRGGVKPSVEICSDNLDNDCDGEVDEDCINIEKTCSNGVQDNDEEGVDCGGSCPNECRSFPWGMIMIVMGILVLLGLVVAYNMGVV